MAKKRKRKQQLVSVVVGLGFLVILVAFGMMQSQSWDKSWGETGTAALTIAVPPTHPTATP